MAPPPKSRSIRPFHFVYCGYAQVGRTTSYWQLFRHLEIETVSFLVNDTKNLYLFHAGAVTKGRTGILLPGTSGAGKSSITLALLLRDYRYMSDELALVDVSTGELHPFPKPLSLKNISIFSGLAIHNIWLGPEAGEKAREEPVWYIHPEDIKPNTIGEPTPIRYIIFPTYDPAATPQIKPLTSDEAMRRLIDNSVKFHQFGRHGLHLLANLLEEAECFCLTSNDLEKTTALINELTQG